MRKVSLGMMLSLDGYVADSTGDIPFVSFDDELEAYLLGVLADMDTMLVGRVNYEEQAAYWPRSTEPYAPLVNGHQKIVFSSTLRRVDWQNSRLATGSPAEEIERLRRQPGKTIGVAGGARFAQSLLRDGLIDELRLTIHPAVIGTGIPLFAEPQRLKLVDLKRFKSGVVTHIYQPA
jgi:dihydrofolate reductase